MSSKQRRIIGKQRLAHEKWQRENIQVASAQSPYLKALNEHFLSENLEMPIWVEGMGRSGAEDSLPWLELVLDSCELLISRGEEGLATLQALTSGTIAQIYGLKNLPRQSPKYRALHARNGKMVRRNLGELCLNPEFAIRWNEACEMVIQGRSQSDR